VHGSIDIAQQLQFREQQHRVESTNGSSTIAFDWGGDGPPMVFAHATGLHSRTWLATVHALRDRYHCYGIDTRGQGESIVSDAETFSWVGIADDWSAALDVLGLLGRGDVYGVGHSQGGYAVIEAARRHPDTFRALFAYEPVIFEVPLDGELIPNSTDNHMSAIARKRRAIFASRQAALENFTGKGPFSTVDEDVLRCYVNWGFNDCEDGTVTLKCTPEHEAMLFANSATRLWHDLPTINCPTTVGLGEFTIDSFHAMVPSVAERLPHGRLMRFSGRTHFGVFERVSEMAETIHNSFTNFTD
jgi:pimeloyl-ACP methyl ester carboxylesterase